MGTSVVDYGSLTNAVANWMTRANNADLISNIPDFISFTEDVFNYGYDDGAMQIPALRVQQMEVTSFTMVLPNSTNTAVLPLDFLELRRLFYYNGTYKRKLTYATPDQMDSAYGNAPSGPQAFYTIMGDAILLAANVNTTTSLIGGYFQKIPPLSSSNTVNWLVSARPSAYLHGCLLQASLFVGDDDGAAKWGRMLMGDIRAFQKQDLKGKYSGNVLQMKTDTGNP